MMEKAVYPEEEANDQGFAKKLAALGDIYIGDAFPVRNGRMYRLICRG